MTVERLDALERRLDAAEAQLAIIRLEAEYARSWDAGDGAAYARCYMPDGAFELYGADGVRMKPVYRGRAELEALCAKITPTMVGLHFMHLPRITVTGDTATSRIHFDYRGILTGDPRYTGRRETSGYYDVRYRRTDEGWKIEYRLEKKVFGQLCEGFDIYVQPDFP